MKLFREVGRTLELFDRSINKTHLLNFVCTVPRHFDLLSVTLNLDQSLVSLTYFPELS
jgi:hypothetical protein